MREPGVRARYMQTFLRQLERLEAEDLRAIRSEVGDDTWVRIAKANPLGWLPIDVNVAATRAVAARLGPRRTHEFFQSLLSSAFETPLLEGLIRAVLRVVGDDPGGYLAWVSKGFELMFRDCGRWRVVGREPGAATIEVVGLPQAFVADPVWLGSVASALNALFVMAKREGAVTVRDVDAAEGRAAFRLRWETAEV